MYAHNGTSSKWSLYLITITRWKTGADDMRVYLYRNMRKGHQYHKISMAVVPHASLLVLFCGIPFSVGINADLDPKIFMGTPEMIRYDGYPVEIHNVITTDGFILQTHRIPNGRYSNKTDINRPVVLFQHGLLSSSDEFVLNGLNSSLAYLLADNGMDVWLANNRGNAYATRNLYYNDTQDEFWDWSWDEMAELDLPATVDYILKETNSSQLYYVGHSQGTEIMFAQLSQDPVFAEKIKLFIAWAPIGKLGHIKGLLKLLADISIEPEIYYTIFGRKDFLTNTSFSMFLASRVCVHEPITFVCSVASSLSGFDFQQINMSRVPRYLAHTTEGTSIRNMIHYIQSVRSDQFQKYDYGSPAGNMAHYNQTTPPQYVVQNIKTPVALYTGGHDWLSDPTDATYLMENLPNIVHQKTFPHWDHVDFAIAMDAQAMLYRDNLNLIKQMHARK